MNHFPFCKCSQGHHILRCMCVCVCVCVRRSLTREQSVKESVKGCHCPMTLGTQPPSLLTTCLSIAFDCVSLWACGLVGVYLHGMDLHRMPVEIMMIAIRQLRVYFF